MAEENHKSNSVNPRLSNFGLQSVLSNLNADLFTSKELAALDEIESYFSLKEIINNAKEYHSSDDEASTSNGERRVIGQLPPLPMHVPGLPPPMHVAQVPPPMPQVPPPPMPTHIRNRITDLNGTDVTYVIRKNLFKTDLNISNNRLSMPCKEIKYEFLTEIEKSLLDTKEDKKPFGLEVVVLDHSFREFHMLLKKWTMTTCVYNLVKTWNVLLKQNNWNENTKLNHILHIWAFRINGKLHFVLIDNEDI